MWESDRSNEACAEFSHRFPRIRAKGRKGEISPGPLHQVSENSTQQKVMVGNHRRRTRDSKCSLLNYTFPYHKTYLRPRKNGENGEWEIRRRNESSFGCYSTTFFARSRERLMRNLKRRGETKR